MCEIQVNLHAVRVSALFCISRETSVISIETERMASRYEEIHTSASSATPRICTVAARIRIRERIVVIVHVGLLRHRIVHVARVGVGRRPLAGIGVLAAYALERVAVAVVVAVQPILHELAAVAAVRAHGETPVRSNDLLAPRVKARRGAPAGETLAVMISMGFLLTLPRKRMAFVASRVGALCCHC